MFSPESRAHLRETINAAAAHTSAPYRGAAEGRRRPFCDRKEEIMEE